MKEGSIEKYRASIADLTLIDDCIIHVVVHDQVDVQFENLIEVRKKNIEFAKGKDYCVMLESGSFVDYSKKTREASASEEYSGGRIALAIIINSLAIKILADIYLRINKPFCPTKAFKNKEDALKWLQEKRDLHNLKKNSTIQKSAS